MISTTFEREVNIITFKIRYKSLKQWEILKCTALQHKSGYRLLSVCGSGCLHGIKNNEQETRNFKW